MKEYQNIIKEVCDELGISFELLSKDYIVKLSKDNVYKYIYGYKFSLNDHGIGLILDDKYATYEVLRNLNYNTVEIIPLFNNYNINKVVSYLDDYKFIVIKPSNGTCGNNVYKTNNVTEALFIIDKLLDSNDFVCMSPYYDIIHEYRVIVLNDEIKVMYGKSRPIVVGDGRNSVRNLLLKFNYNYYNNPANINKLSIDVERIPDVGEVVEVGFKFNLSRGSNLFTITDEDVISNLKSISLSLVKDLNIKFASIDIVETTDHEFKILECNSGIMMNNFIKLYPNGRNIAKSIYKDAIISYFND